MSSPNPNVFDTLAADSAGEDPRDARLLADLADRLAAFDGNPVETLIADFQTVGFERDTRAWLAPGLSAAPAPLPPEAVTRVSELNHVIDNAWIAQVATRNSVGPDVVVRRLAALLPKAIKTLTPRGEVPSMKVLTIGLDALRRRATR